MEFRIASSFQDSLSKLTNDEQKQAKLTAFDLQSDPSSPGLKFHRIDRSRDPNFWSLRANRDIRLIVHKTGADMLLCYVDHHDDAYAWAERRKIEAHPKTGALQIVEIRELVREHEVRQPPATPVSPGKPRVCDAFTDDELLAFGVPPEWLPDVRAADEDAILDIAEHLPDEAAEAVLEIAVGKTPAAAPVAKPDDNPYAHPDAQRRFRVMADTEELALALEYPWERWTTFLHPTQRTLVERRYNGPMRVSGTAGTGKTIVALHRAVWLAREVADSRVLLTTFSDTLASALKTKLNILISGEPKLAERIEVEALDAVATRLYRTAFGRTPKLVTTDHVSAMLRAEHAAVADLSGYSAAFVISEWEDVVDARQITSWEGYRDAPRLGRKLRLAEAKREMLWQLFETVHSKLAADGCMTMRGVYNQLKQHHRETKVAPYDFVVLDEAQDVGISALEWLAAICHKHPDSLFCAGDTGQRIFQQPFSWKACGVDIRGRARSLKINYRTSHQIRQQADRLLDASVIDVDGNEEDRTGTVSMFNGPMPSIEISDSVEDEIEAVANWLKQSIDDGFKPHEIGVFVRESDLLDRASKAVESAGQGTTVLDDRVTTITGRLAIGTMHLAKGLEFRAVVVMACDDDNLPSQERIENAADRADLDTILTTERHLLYVACTRARDRLLVSAVGPASEFLDDLGVASSR